MMENKILERTKLYQMVIDWSVEDDCYVVGFPGVKGVKTHGHKIEDAAAMGIEALELYLESCEGVEIPSPVKGKMVSSREVAVYLCDIAASHELGETDVRVYESEAALRESHDCTDECGGVVKATVVIPARVRTSVTASALPQ